MKTVCKIFLLCFCLHVYTFDNNLIIIVDNLQQETAKTEEVNMTHQCITALQQRGASVLVSTTLWKNIVDRKKKFEKKLQDSSSIESNIFAMYKRTNTELKLAEYNLAIINQKLTQSWFELEYPQLAKLSQEKFNQLRFEFLCYIFKFDINHWRVYGARTGMLLFVPKEYQYKIEGSYELFDERALLKHVDKKSYIVQSLEKLLKNDKNRWVIYLTGHGHPKSSKQLANIAGLKIEEFRTFLEYLNNKMTIKIMVYSSCYGGGVHTVEPYTDLKLKYPVIVTAATDAPIFGFGLFEGVKLPPYDDQFKLHAVDVLKNHGLLPCTMQNYKAFFKRAWKGQFDLNLVQLISKFFICDFIECHAQKVENYPLIRKAGDLIFRPVREGLIAKLVQKITTNGTFFSHKPLLLYSKKIKKIKIDRAVPIISMLPGMVSHEIGELSAGLVPLSRLIAESFLSLEDMQAYKNFIIKKLVCFDDLIGSKKIINFTDILILHQENLMPKFFEKKVEALIFLKRINSYYLLVWNNKSITDIILLNEEKIRAMSEIKNFVQQGINYQAMRTPENLLTFDAYIDNKNFQQDIVDECVHIKICKK
jgi:hypothetical protein